MHKFIFSERARPGSQLPEPVNEQNSGKRRPRKSLVWARRCPLCVALVSPGHRACPAMATSNLTLHTLRTGNPPRTANTHISTPLAPEHTPHPTYTPYKSNAPNSHQSYTDASDDKTGPETGGHGPDPLTFGRIILIASFYSRTNTVAAPIPVPMHIDVTKTCIQKPHAARQHSSRCIQLTRAHLALPATQLAQARRNLSRTCAAWRSPESPSASKYRVSPSQNTACTYLTGGPERSLRRSRSPSRHRDRAPSRSTHTGTQTPR